MSWVATIGGDICDSCCPACLCEPRCLIPLQDVHGQLATFQRRHFNPTALRFATQLQDVYDQLRGTKNALRKLLGKRVRRAVRSCYLLLFS